MKTKLRRVAILALVLVLLISNTVGANASTGNPSITVSTYADLCNALENAENGDIIGIKGVIHIPSPDALEYTSVTLKRMEVGAKLIFSDPYRNGATSNVRFIEFDGNSSSFSGREPFIVIVGNVSFKMCEFVNCYYEGGKGGDVDTGTTGGAVYVGSGSATFSSCRFDDNCADYGAGIFNRGTVTLENCTLEGNWAEEIGGAIYNAGMLIIKNTELKGNTARIGGGLYNSGTTELYSSLVWNNTATIHGSDLANEGSLTDFTTDEEYNTLLNRYNLYYGGWADELDTSVGGIGEYKKFIATDTTPTPIDPEPIDPPVEPSAPTEPDEGDNTGENEGTTTPEDPDQGNTEEPTTPDGGEDNTDPPITPPDEGGDSTGADPVEPDTPSDTGKGDTTDNSSTDNSDHSTTDNSQSSTDNSTTDNSIVDNSQTSTSIDNSTSSSTVDNSSVVSNTDNSTHKEENSKTENSNNNSTTYNYYTSPETTGGSQSVLPPINVNLTIPQEKEPEIGSQELTEAKQNIYIDAEGVNVKYEYTADGVSISISSYIAPESSPEAEAIPTAYSPVETPQEPTENSISWVDYVSMILLALLVFAELRDRWFRLKNKAE